MVDILADIPTPANQRILEVYAWVAVQPDGSEGIISLGIMPLVTAKRDLALRMREAAERAAGLKPHVKARLLHFRLTGEMTY